MEIRNKPATFAVLVSTRAYAYTTLQPYWIDGLTVKGRITNTEGLTDVQQEIVKCCAECEDNVLLKKFSTNEVTMMNLFKKMEKDEQVANLFWNYIGKRYATIVRLVMQNADIPVYFRKPNVGVIYDKDLINVCRETVLPDYLFKLTENGLDYKFRFKASGEIIWMKYHNQFLPLNQSLPCTFILNNQLCLCETVGHKAIGAIAKNGSIHVPPEKVGIYLESFVKKVLQTTHASCEGFDVSTCHQSLHAKLVETTDIFGKTALRLDFCYGSDHYNANSEKKHKVELEQDNGRYHFTVSLRNFKLEDELVNVLNRQQLYANGDFFYLSDKARQLKDVLETPEIVNNFELVHEFGITTFADEKEDWFDVKMMVNIRGFQIPFARFRKYLLKHETSYQLPDGTTFHLPEEWFSNYADLLDKAEVDGDQIKLHKQFAGLIADQCPCAKNYLQKITVEEHNEPQKLNAELRHYQKQGYNYLINLYQKGLGGCLADDMGLGKTLQFIAFFSQLYSNCRPVRQEQPAKIGKRTWQYHSSEPSLFEQQLGEEETGKIQEEAAGEQIPASIIVVPTTVLFNWQKELQKFAPHLRYTVHYGNKRANAITARTFNAYNLVLTTYSILVRDADKLQNYNFECAVLDESQNIKNPQSQNHNCAKQLKAKSHFTITGTPIENSLNDLWAQMSFSCPGLLGSYHSFNEHYTSDNADRLAALRKMVAPFILRRTKVEVCPELPELTKTDIWCEMGEDAQKAYEKEKSAARNLLLHIGPGKNALNVLQQLTRLRQLACDPCILTDYANLTSAKRQAVVEMVTPLYQSKQKVLLFSAFVSQLNLIAEDLKQQGIPFVMLTGENTSQERQKLVERFQNDQNLTCLLISLKAGSTGINLTAANYVFLLSPWWNPFVEQQAIDRAYRIGQQNNVMVYNFITKDTVEEKILHLQEKKRQLSDSIIGTESPLQHLTTEELEALM